MIKNMDILLIVVGHKYVLTDPCPEIGDRSNKKEYKVHMEDRVK